MRVIGMAALIAALLSPRETQAQSKPSFDCARASQNVEIAICRSQELSALDRQMDLIYRDRLAGLSEGERASFRHGARAWIAERNLYCDEGTHADRDCISTSYRRRIEGLRRVGRTQDNSPYRTTGDAVWLQIASDSDRQSAINRAYFYGDLIDHMTDTKVFLSSNGWYAIVVGPVRRSRLHPVRWEVRLNIPELDPDDFATSGNGYLNLVYSAGKNLSYAYRPPVAQDSEVDTMASIGKTMPERTPTIAPAPAPLPVSPPVSSPAEPPTTSVATRLGTGVAGSRGATCSLASVRERQSLCYILAVGEHACSEGIESHAGGTGFLAGATSGAVCNAAVTKLSNGTLSSEMLIASALIGGVDSVGEDLMGSESVVSNFIGLVMRVGATAGKFRMAEQCADLEAYNCGYR